MTVIELDDAGFGALVGAASRPVVVVFVASWCSPSRSIRGELPALAKSVNGLATIGVVDVDVAQGVAVEVGLSGLPMVAVFADGREIARHVGQLGGRALRSWLIGALEDG